MGLGKSICALASIVDVKPKRVLIVCPAFLKSNWQNEIGKFTKGVEATIVSYASLSKVKGKFDFVIADEAHFLKNHKTKRSKNFEEIMLKSKPSHMLLLTGTPIINKVGEFWNLLRLVHLSGNLPEFDRFAKKSQYFKFQYYFSNAITQYFGNREVVKFEGIKNVSELKNLVNKARIRMKAKDVLNLPETTDIDLIIKDKSSYDKELEKIINENKELNHEAYMRCKANNAASKADFTTKTVNEILENGERVVVFTDHRDSASKIARALGVEAITGETPVAKRAGLVSEFEKSNEPLALVATIGALSVGVNLTSASYMVFNDLPFTSTDLEQAKKRIHRIGQSKKCFYYYVYISEMDRKLQKMIYDKRTLLETL